MNTQDYSTLEHIVMHTTDEARRIEATNQLATLHALDGLKRRTATIKREIAREALSQAAEAILTRSSEAYVQQVLENLSDGHYMASYEVKPNLLVVTVTVEATHVQIDSNDIVPTFEKKSFKIALN